MYFQYKKRNAGREITPSPGGLALLGRGCTMLQAWPVRRFVNNDILVGQEIVRVTEPDVVGDEE